jgi:hypothetical protein
MRMRVELLYFIYVVAILQCLVMTSGYGRSLTNTELAAIARSKGSSRQSVEVAIKVRMTAICQGLS